METNIKIDSTGIENIYVLMKERYKYDLSVFNHDFINKSLERRKIDLNIHGNSEYAKYLNSNEEEAKKFFGSLTITCTKFFRDQVTFAFLEQTILPILLSQKKDISDFRVWSAGCSTGQEAYSLAILLADMVETSGKKIKIRIFATDKNEPALHVAKKGVYEIENVQNLRLKHINSYFIKSGNSYTANPTIKKLISFSKYDLLDPASSNPLESIYGDFDLVICSNVLMYYTQDRQHFIIDKLVKSLSSTGVLVTGEAERGLVDGWSSLKMVSQQIPIFKHFSLEHSIKPIWRDPVYEDN